MKDDASATIKQSGGIAAAEAAFMEKPFAQSAYTTVDGVRLHYRVWEPLQSPSKGNVLLVHGFGGSTFCWRKNVKALTDRDYLVAAVDLPGFGYSDRSRGIDHSHENRSRLLWDLISALDASYPCKGDLWILVGHSMGAGTVTAMAIEKPERTCALIFVDGAVLTQGGRGSPLTRYPPVSRCIEWIARQFLFTRRRISAFLVSAYGSVPDQQAVQGYLAPLLLAATEGSLMEMTHTSKNIAREKLAHVNVPIYAIWGEKDTWVPLKEAYRLQAIWPGMRIQIIPDAHHCPMETHEDQFNQYLLEDLQRMNSSA